MNYEIIFKQEFKSIINKYDMKYLNVDKDEFAIVGKGFALIFMIHLDDIFISYAMLNSHKELEVYKFDSFIVEKFNAIDRENIKEASTVEERIKNRLKIITSGLINHWDGLMKGDKNWVPEYLVYPLAGKPKKANKKLIDIKEI